ncbi:hypothetical protein [Streptomyces huiliensis]|uniref:hypothetical protein n=1 Tax=Streptomyces huiliensis TaxID=2876027 RepID=UPI001CBFB6EA|nr:hypothetical protein [Streptomyces huiliensis]MBZ4320669.1 hypothetical protein [Streptomyces huiliensis]
MSEGRRRTRPWGPLRGSSAPAQELANLQRAWLDKAGLSVRDVAGALHCEHFTDGRVPARSTVADRLAGANPQWDFVEAVADICSRDDAERTRMLNEARPLWELVRAVPARRDGRTGQPDRSSAGGRDDASRPAPDGAGGAGGAGGSGGEALRAALERAAEAERARDGASQLSVLLLTTVGRLEKDLSELRAARGRADGTRTERLRRTHRRLQRSESRRVLLAAELRRASAELDALRGASASGPDDRTTGCPVSPSGRPDNRPDAHPDNRPDAHPDDRPDPTPDHRPDNRGGPRTTPPDNSPLTAVRALADARTAGQDAAARRLAATVGRDGNPGFVQRVVALLRANEQPTDADHVLTAVARTRDPARVPGVLAALFHAGRRPDASYVLASVARAEPADRVMDVVAALRETGRHTDVYELLLAAGRLRALNGVPPLIRALEAADRPEDARWLLGFAARERPRTEAHALAEILRLAGNPAAATHLLAELRPQVPPQPTPEDPPPLPVPTRPLPTPTSGLATVIRMDPTPGPRAPVLGRHRPNGPYVERVPPPRR